MKRLLGLTCCLGLILMIVGCQATAKDESSSSGRSIDPVNRGAYLVETLGCNDCHTPWTMGPNGPAPDMTRMLSGHPANLDMPPAPDLGEGPWAWAGSGTMTAFAGPWGVSFAPNLTPDEATGFGIFTEEAFIQAMRTGKHMGVGRPILPPMPWPGYGKLTDDDLGAIYAYLKSIPAIENKVPDHRPPAQGAGGHD